MTLRREIESSRQGVDDQVESIQKLDDEIEALAKECNELSKEWGLKPLGPGEQLIEFNAKAESLPSLEALHVTEITVGKVIEYFDARKGCLMSTWLAEQGDPWLFDKRRHMGSIEIDSKDGVYGPEASNYFSDTCRQAGETCCEKNSPGFLDYSLCELSRRADERFEDLLALKQIHRDAVQLLMVLHELEEVRNFYEMNKNDDSQ